MPTPSPIPISFASAHLPASRPPVDLSTLDLGSLVRGRDAAFERAQGHAPPITRVCPVARPIPLGGRLHVVDELRIADLAEIQAWLEAESPHPLADMPPSWADPEPETRTARLKVAWEDAASWPVRYGSDRAAVLLGTTGGRAFFLYLCLRRGDPGFGVAGALGLLAEVTPIEWAGLRRVAYGLTPRREIADEVAPDRTPGRLSSWCAAFHRANEAPGGPGYAEIGELTISQWRNLCSKGKSTDTSAEFAAQSRRVREILEAAHVEAEHQQDHL
jgi:hypothetical protein